MEFMQHTYTNNLTPKFGCLKENYLQPTEWKQLHDTHKKRWAEQNPLEDTENTGIQFTKQNPGHCSEQERVKLPDDRYQNPLQKIQLQTTERPSSDMVNIARIPLDILIRTIVPHLDKCKVRQLQLHFTKLRRNEINIMDFMRFTRQIVGKQLFQRAVDSIQLQIHTHLSSATTPLRDGINTTRPLKRRSNSQQEPLGAPDNHSSLSSCKKKKVSEASIEQSVGELSDITSLSGLDMREEEQLLAGHEEELWISGAAQKVVQEEERVILLKIPLQRRLAKIISLYSITCIGDNVEWCLSMERMRRLISDLIRLSKMRVDFEAGHQSIITSDVQLQILTMNQKAKEVCEGRQAEEDGMLQKVNEANEVAEDNMQTTANVAVRTAVKERSMLSKWELMAKQFPQKCEGRIREANKVPEDSMLTNGASITGGTTLGADDILLKWQRMAEQARQKRERGICSDYNFTVDTKAVNFAIRTAVGGEDVILKWKLMAEQGWQKSEGTICKHAPPTTDTSSAVLSTSRRPSRDTEEHENTSSSSPSVKLAWRRKPVSRLSVRVRDVIAVLEREPQMSKSALLYRLYEKTHADAVSAEQFNPSGKKNIEPVLDCQFYFKLNKGSFTFDWSE